MTRLRIRLHQPHVDGFVEAAAVVAVRRLADADGKVAKVWRSKEQPITVYGGNFGPDGGGGTFTNFKLPKGGYYSVDITRPRGPDISREFCIGDDEDRPETIQMEASPHEYLAWEQYAGILRSDSYRRETVGSSTAPSATGSKRLDELLVQGQQKIDALYSQVRDLPTAFAATVPASEEAWARVAELTRGDARGWATAGAPLTWAGITDDDYATWTPEMPDRDEGIKLIRRLKRRNPPSALSAKYPRWIAIDTGGQIDLASVPWPWWGGADRNPAENIRFLYDRVRPSPVDRDLPGRFTLSVHDRRWFGLLEFLASGRLSRAGDIIKSVTENEQLGELFHAELALYGKVKGPLVATAGAIVLIAGADSTEEQPWDRWVENLSRWFPGIPDGPILLGCRRVTQAKTLGSLKQAYRHLRTGIRRGLPFFSASIRMLTVTLAQIGVDVPDADASRRVVASVAARVDPDQPFTVLRL